MVAEKRTELAEALSQLAAAEFALGPEWEAAHALCQAHEGERLFDAVHAFCHRIEGDQRNAAYWYRHAGRSVATGSFADECAALRSEIEATG